MKLFTIMALIIMSSVAMSQTEIETDTDLEALEAEVINSEVINVDGVVKEKPVSDPELETIKAEISKQKNEIVLNKVKAKNFKELSKSVGALSQTTEEMLIEKKAAREEIANYNAKVKCLQEEYPGRECNKYLKRKE